MGGFRDCGVPGGLFGAGPAGLACLSCGDLVTVRGSPAVSWRGACGGQVGEGLAAPAAGAGRRPAAARRALSSWRAVQAVRMRWLRTVSRQVSQSMSGVRPISRVQPRVMLLLAGSLAVAKVRSAPLRRV